MARIENRIPYPTLVGERARETPDRPFARISKTADVQDGYQNFTYKQLAKAIDHMSWWLDENLGTSVNLDTIAYMGASDLRYTIMYVAASKRLGSLLDSTNCKTLIALDDIMHHWEKLGPEVAGFRVLTLPPFEDFLNLNDHEVKPYSYTRTWDDIKDETICFALTSGTAGLPKLIPHTHYVFSIWKIGVIRTLSENANIVVHFPPSWILGLALYIHFPLDIGTVPILLPATAPLPTTADYIDKVHTAVHADGGIYIPSLLKELAGNPTYIKHMEGMKWIRFAGASLDRQTGDIFSTFVRVQSIMGATETGPYGLLASEPAEWMYNNFDPDTGFRFLPYQDDMYESVVVRHTEQGKAGTQMGFHIFPELDVYHMKDVWRQHPTKKGLWQMCGRTDDFVKLATLTKFNAASIEGILLKEPLVKAVVMGGQGRKMSFMLIELADQEMDVKEAMAKLWPVIQEANKGISSEIRVKREMVLFATKGKPFKKTLGKQTTNRRATTEDYAEEIEELYRGMPR